MDLWLMFVLILCSLVDQYSALVTSKPTTTPSTTVTEPTIASTQAPISTEIIKQILKLNTDGILKPKNSSLFDKCYDYLLGPKWTCWTNAVEEYDLSLEVLMTETKFSGHESHCCVINVVEECIRVSVDFYEPCQSTDAREYFDSLHGFYMNNGCDKYKRQVNEHCHLNSAITKFNMSIIMIVLSTFICHFIVQLFH